VPVSKVLGLDNNQFGYLLLYLDTLLGLLSLLAWAQGMEKNGGVLSLGRIQVPGRHIEHLTCIVNHSW
jgi:hypothetical protein